MTFAGIRRLIVVQSVPHLVCSARSSWLGEELVRWLSGRAAQAALSVVAIIAGVALSLIVIGNLASGRPWIYMVLLVASVLFLKPLTVLFVTRDTHRLALSPDGIAIEDLKTGRVRQEPWQRGSTLSVAVIGKHVTAFLGDRDPIADISIESQENERPVSFSARMPAGNAGALVRQVAVWTADAVRATDASQDFVAPYRACPLCLAPGCTCVTGVRDLLIIPVFIAGHDPAWSMLALVGPFLYNIIRAKGRDEVFLLLLIGLAVPALISLRRLHRGVLTRQLRLGPDGYQICKPTAPLKPTRWNKQGLHLKRMHFQQARLGFTHPITGLALETPSVEIPSPALVQLRSQIQRWSHGLDRKTFGFPID